MSVSVDPSLVEEDVEFTEEQHDIWRALYARQAPKVRKFACKEYLAGSENLKLPADRIPSVSWMNERITPRTGWRTVRTKVRYSDAVQWYKHFARKEFLVTDYVRSREELEFTPEPDMFHDVYGHLPYFTLPEYQTGGLVQHGVWPDPRGWRAEGFWDGVDLLECGDGARAGGQHAANGLQGGDHRQL